MLSLSQKLSLTNIKNASGAAAWSPTDETSIEAWYSKGVGVTLNGSDVSQWNDSSGNNIHMAQSVASAQPAYSNGILTFDGSDDHLTSTGQISITGDFVIGAVVNPTSHSGVILGDLNTQGEFFKFINSTSVRLKINNGANADIALDSGTFAQSNLVLTRNSGTVSLWHNGVLQSDTETLSGTADIDTIGRRFPGASPFDGTIEEIQIYSSYSSGLVTNVNTYLAAL
tara:strand:+ start:1013 stop:1693 length:681 start_codon:yes stop_codon:yes gene_type:complete